MSRTSAGTSSFVSIFDIVVHYSPYAPVVKRISHQSSELTFQVRILAGAKSKVSISVRVQGIEPGSFDWQPNVLPLNHTRLDLFFRQTQPVHCPAAPPVSSTEAISA